jgi:predicted nucleic acid-binding protein
MTLYVDTSAIVRRYVSDRHTPLVHAEMRAHTTWVTSALTRTEAQLVLRRAATGPLHLEELWAAFRADWDAMAVVPVDDRCLAEAVEIGATHGLATADAVQLAAASRLPQPARFLTLTSSQLPAAAHLGFAVASPLAD